jgi:hypothetical protein
MLKYHRNSNICKYKKQRNRVNNLKKIAKENFEINLDNIILENASTFASSNLDIKLKYLFNKSLFSSSS